MNSNGKSSRVALPDSECIECCWVVGKIYHIFFYYVFSEVGRCVWKDYGKYVGPATTRVV